MKTHVKTVNVEIEGIINSTALEIYETRHPPQCSHGPRLIWLFLNLNIKTSNLDCNLQNHHQHCNCMSFNNGKTSIRNIVYVSKFIVIIRKMNSGLAFEYVIRYLPMSCSTHVKCVCEIFRWIYILYDLQRRKHGCS